MVVTPQVFCHQTNWPYEIAGISPFDQGVLVERAYATSQESMTMDSAPGPPPAPHLQILRLLGRGGYADVYLADDTDNNRQVAVKVLTGLLKKADEERFEQEVRIHLPLSSHPNIVTVFDTGRAPDGSPYLVMEYIEDGTLTDHLVKHGAMPWREAVETLLPICHAVQAAHDTGTIHRDIKPSNILMGSDGAKLGDFGIACGRDATSPEFAVSWLHAAPEAHDNARDTRSDVYSLGSTLYEMLKGTAPFWAPEQPVATLMYRILDESPAALQPPLVPSWLSALISRCLDKNPLFRPQTAAALAEMMERGLEKEVAAG